jgi:hypothetical protein
VTALEELTATALLGTDRRLPSPPATGAALAAALERQPWDSDPPAALLAAAALLATHERAGRTAATLNPPSTEPAGVEQAARCPVGAMVLLQQLLADQFGQPLLEEWLLRAAARSELVPPLLLPVMLDLALVRTQLRRPLLAAGGRRLGWLAEHRREWSWATASTSEAPEQAWQHMTFDARALLLGDVRASDPDRGRALVQSTWEADPPEQRTRFLAELKDTLVQSDEPLLEQALNDRRRDVRVMSAELLARLTGSAYQRRMWERVAPLIRSGRRSLIVELPPEPDACLQRELTVLAPLPGLGRRATQLAEMVAATELAAWERELRKPPPAILAQAAASENGDALIGGWLKASARQRNPEWCAAIALHLRDPKPLIAVPAAAVEPAAVALLRAAGDDLILFVLRWLAPPWTRALSGLATERVARSGLGPVRPSDVVFIAYNMHPSVIEDASAAFAELGGPGATAMLRVLDLRQALISELPTP